MQGTAKQKEAIIALCDDIHTTVIYGGAAGGGKSFLGCVWLLLMANSYPKTRWFIGREELKRIRQSTIITWHKVCAEMGFKDFKINGQDNYILLGNGSQIDLLDLQYVPRDPLYERYGSIEYTGGWIEEGGEVNFGAYDTLKTRVGRHLNDVYKLKPKILITCNPKKNWLYTEFYKPFKAKILPENTLFIQAFIQDNPNLTEDYIENLKSTKDKAKKERLLYGNWEYDDDPSQLIDYDSICDYFTNGFIKPNGIKYITADIARKGKDTTVARVWHGMVVIERVSLKVSLVTDSANMIKSLANKHGVSMSNTLVDEDGVGGGVVDILRCRGFINNSRPLKGENYNNLKSQCSFEMAKKITSKEVYEPCTNEELKNIITEEMEQVKQHNIDDDGKVAIIPKDKVKELIGRSPDEWDSIMMRAYFWMTSTLAIG